MEAASLLQGELVGEAWCYPRSSLTPAGVENTHGFSHTVHFDNRQVWIKDFFSEGWLSSKTLAKEYKL